MIVRRKTMMVCIDCTKAERVVALLVGCENWTENSISVTVTVAVDSEM
jgi:hypothetical protein